MLLRRTRRWPVLLAPPVLAAMLVVACGEDGADIPPASGDAGTAPDAARDAVPVPPGDTGSDAPPSLDGGRDADATIPDAGPDGPLADAPPDAPPIDEVTLLADIPVVGAVGRRVFGGGRGVVFQYDVGARSVVATTALTGGAPEVVVDSATTIDVMDVRSGIVAYQTGGHVFWRSLTGDAAPVDLGAHPPCVAITSTGTHVYCRATDQTIARWPRVAASPDAGIVIATAVAEGPDLVTDDAFLYLTENGGNVVRIPLAGFGGGPPEAPGYRVLVENESLPHDLAVGVPGDGVVYWAAGVTTDAGRVKGCAKTNGTQCGSSPVVPGFSTHVHYSQRAGAYVAVNDQRRIVFVRFGQPSIQPWHGVDASVVDLAAPAGAILWIDEAARVWRADP